MILAFHKPYGVLSQFTKMEPEHRTLTEFGFPESVHPIGRLDWDSEGLLLLSDEHAWNDLLLHPRHEHERTYHAQVEGIATKEAMTALEKGVLIQGRKTKPCRTNLMPNRPFGTAAPSARPALGQAVDEPNYPPRNPPIRFRLTVPTSWIELKLIEGKNRQVRRMTAAVGFPTLRLVRAAMGGFELGNLEPGTWRELNLKEKQALRNPSLPK